MIEVEGLAFPGVGVFGCEVVEADAEVEFELGGFVLGGDSEVCEEGHGMERRKNWVCVRSVLLGRCHGCRWGRVWPFGRGRQ